MEPQCLVCLVCGKEASWYKVKKSLKDLSSFLPLPFTYCMTVGR